MNNKNNVGVIVDAGHGGDDPGAIANNLVEKDLNLRAAQYMYKRLQELGIPTVIIRGTDETLPKGPRIKRALEAFNNAPNTILIANHINAGGGEGAEIVYALRNEPTLATLALNNIGEAGQPTRQIYQRRLPEDPSKDYYYILRETGNTEPLLVEYGFIDNAKDAKRLNENIERYAEAVVKAIATYAGYTYTPPGAKPPVGPTEPINYYVVQKGDTLYSIAREFGVTVKFLKELNNLTSDTITPGMKLFLDEEYPEATYTVTRGDTLYSIASKFSTTVQAIKDLNNLTTDTLSIGQQLLIPTTSVPEPPIEEKPPVTPPVEEIPPETQIYVVKKGDSLWLIAKNHNTTVDELIRLNDLTNLTLQIGDKLLIPKQPEPTTYTVKKGDTLWSIAKATDTKVEDIKKLNNLTSNLLTIGQQLILPN